MADDTNPAAPDWHVRTVLRLADDALVLGQRVAEWAGHGPVLEEELAMANIGLDLIGQARMLYTHAGRLEGAGRDEDRLAYFRDAREFMNLSLLELPNGDARHDDYALTIVRNWLVATLMVPAWEAMADSRDAELAAIAGKAVKEARGHLRHAREWVVRFGDGTDESHRRAQHALDRLWPYTNEMFCDDDVDRAAAAAGVRPLPSSLRPSWSAAVDQTLGEATLARPADVAFQSTGRQGRHTEHLDLLLAELQSVARAHPGAAR